MSALSFRPLDAGNWPDLVDLFGPTRGASSGCWCMWPRVARADWKAMGRDGRRDAFEAITKAGPPPGLLAYEAGQAVGWVAVGPRARVARFDAAKVSRAERDGDVPDAIFAITCFYVASSHRRQGLTPKLTRAALDFARGNGARAVDVCAIEADRPLIWGDGFVGIASVMRDLGFTEIARRSPRRPLMRYVFPEEGK